MGAARTRVTSKRTHTTKEPKQDRVSQDEIDKRNKYIDNVRRTGIHWEHHVQRLERKYPNSMLSVYAELVADVRRHRAKKADKRAKLEDRKNRKTATHSSSSNELSSSSTSSSGTEASGQTFQSTNVTQAMLERNRGRPRAASKKATMPLRQPIPRQQSASRQASQATYFSLSDDGSSVHDMGVATDASLDDVAPMASADFFASNDTSQPHERKRAATCVSSDSETSKKRSKNSKGSQTRVTQAVSYSEEPAHSVVHSQPEKRSNSKVIRQQTRKNDHAQSMDSSTSSSTLQPFFSSNTNSAGIRNDRAVPRSQAMPSSSAKTATSIGSAIDELMYEDGTAREFIPLKEIAAAMATDTPTPEFYSKNASEAPAQTEHMSGSGSHLGNDTGGSSSFNTKELSTNENLFKVSTGQTTSTRQHIIRDKPDPNAAGRPHTTGSMSEATTSNIDPEIASLIAKPNGLSTFLNSVTSALEAGSAQLLPQASESNNQPVRSDVYQLPTISARLSESVFPASNLTNHGSDRDNTRRANGAGDGERAVESNISSMEASSGEGMDRNILSSSHISRSSSNIQVSAVTPKNLPALTPSTILPANPAASIQQPAAVAMPLSSGDAGIVKLLNENDKQNRSSALLQQDSIPPLLTNCTVASLKINPTFIKVLFDNSFVTISDLADANMTRDDIRLLAASIQEEQKISKSETIVAILRLNAALQRFQQEKGAGR